MKQKLSVLFICGWYPSRIYPTNGDFIERHAKAVSLKHNVSVIHIVTDTFLQTDFDYIFKELDNIKTHIVYTRSARNSIEKFILFFKAFKFLIKKVDQFDIVHLNEIFPFGIFPLYLKYLKKIPYIITEHWTGYHTPYFKDISFYQKLISKVIVNQASFICPVTNDLKKSLVNFGLKGNYNVVENVVDTQKFKPAFIENKLFSIVHISNMLDEHKNISGILNVVKKLQTSIPDFKLKLIGSNSSQYKQYAIKQNINLNHIDFINHIPHKEVIKHLQTANLFLLFSNFENLPCVILESFSCGTPVISSNVGGISEFFPENFGKLINPGNEDELESEIVNFYNRKYSLASKQEMYNYAEKHFSYNTICEKFSSLYYKSLDI